MKSKSILVFHNSTPFYSKNLVKWELDVNEFMYFAQMSKIEK